MKKSLRVLTLLTALLLPLSAAAGCGNTGRGKESGTESEKEKETAQETDGERYMDRQTKITDYLRIYGRTSVKDDTLYLFWTNSGFSMNFRGTGVSAKLTVSTQNPTYYGFLNVYVDGAFAPAKTLCLTKDAEIVLIDGLENGPHTIEVRKRNEAAYGASATVGIAGISVIDGQFITEPPPAPKRTVEFIGDSITSGFGNTVRDGSGAIFSTDTEEGTMTYAVLAAKALGADARILSRSGIGFVKNASCDSFYDHYPLTCSLPGNGLDPTPWDFGASPADVVVINLGTNDGGATRNGAAIPDAEMTEDAVDLLRLVREKNPDAYILWTYGLMGNGRQAALKAAVDRLRSEGDDAVDYFPLVPMNSSKEGVGVHGHPTIGTDITRSIALADKIASEMDWEADASVALEAEILYAENYLTSDAANAVPVTAEAWKKAVADAKALLGTDADLKTLLAAREAILTAHAGLASPEDVSDEYILLDACDDAKGWNIGGTNKGTDKTDRIGGTACLKTEGDGNIYFIKAPGNYHVPLPDDWQNWYLEMWLYLDDPSLLRGGSNLEFSQEVDQIEFAWEVSTLGLEPGWNHLQLKLGTAMQSGMANFKTLENIRLFLFLSGPAVFKVDDIVLSRGKYAPDRSGLDALIAEAEALLPEGNSETETLLRRAKNACSQREVDLFTERLEKLLA